MPSLDRMLAPRSIAVVGASDRPGSVGDQVMRQLVNGGFAGSVHPVNPRHEHLHGLPCHAAVSELPPVDHVVLAVGNAHLESQVAQAVAAGASSLTIFASCHGEASDGSPLRHRLRRLAGDVPICGGNGMGFVNLERRVRVTGFHQPYQLEPGGVTFLTHSGSLFSAMLHNRRRVTFNLVVSTGIEINTTMDRYLHHALQLESTTVVALFLETVRDPGGFVAAIQAAAQRDVPIVALKVGSTEPGRRAVATHSEAIAGDDAVYEALFAAHGVHRVASMDEMLDTVELFAAGRRAGPGGLGAVHDSGGERALLVDTAHRLGVPLPAPSDPTTQRLAAVLDPGLEPANPVDAWGTGRDAEKVFTECLAALCDDDGVAAVALCVDLTDDEDDASYSGAAVTAAAATTKPVFVLANLRAAVDDRQAAALRRAGVPVLEGTDSGLAAVGHLLAHHRHRTTASRAERITSAVTPTEPVADESSALALLAAYGIPTARHRLVSSMDAALAAADEFGYPVVLKTAVAGIAHKSDVGGVAVGLHGAGDVRAAYLDLERRLGADAIVAATASPGVEVALGMVDDPQFGPVLLAAAGGVLVEAIPGRIAALPPLDAARARALVDALPIRPLLDGRRGSPRYDVDALVDVVVRFSELAADAAWARVIDVNPVIVGTRGCVAVDALVVTHP